MSDGTCARSDCAKSVKSRGLCSAHYEAERVSRQAPCSVPDCGKPIQSRELCGMHRSRLREVGALTRPRHPSRWDVFWSYVNVGLCWEWTGGTNGSSGHGKFTAGGRPVRPYRWLWEQLVGPIPAGLVLDHLCMNPCCVNPDHLEPVTRAVNNQRAAASRRW